MLTPGSVIELIIEKPAAGGRMIARHDGQVVLVSAAIPGERVRALVERVSQGVGYAATVDLVESDADRRLAAGDWACGGNVYAHVRYPRQLVIKGQVITDALARIGRISLADPVSVAPSPEQGYRMRARFHVRGRTLGFFREGTHQLCDATRTGQLLPETNDLVRQLSEWVAAGRLAGVTQVELAENIPATERALHVELDRPVTPVALSELSKMPTLVGVSASSASTGRTITVGGTPCVLDRLVLQWTAAGNLREAEVSLQHHAQAFFQSNRYLLSALASRVVSLVPDGPVVDLYAGVGLFSASLAAAGWSSIVAVEGDRAAAADLSANASPFGAALRAQEISVERYLAEQPVPEGTTVIVDPPRTGMSREAGAAIAAQRASRLIYVSCDVATFARDARRLIDAGYTLAHLEGFDLFPNTAHVEAVAVFERR